MDPITVAVDFVLRLTGTVIRRNIPHQPDPVCPRESFGWLADLEASWRTIRDEADRAQSLRIVPRDSELLNPLSIPVAGAWQLLPLRTHNGWVTTVVDHFPRTTDLLKQISGLRCADLAVLQARSAIPPHRGTNWGVLRGHLALRVPTGPGRCELTFPADDGSQSWREGEGFVFDDMREHAAVNERDGERMVLLLEVDRPLSQPARALNHLALQVYRLHPVVRGTHRRLRTIDWRAEP